MAAGWDNERVSLPARAGVGFKPEHFEAVASAPQPIGFFEIHAENYMGAGGVPHAQLGFLRERYALSIHGVGLSIGSPGRLDPEHLTRVKRLCDRYQPESFSEHLAWSRHNGVYYDDLLPLPYTEARLAAVIANVDEAQNFLQRRLLLENPATYLAFDDSTIPEPEFLAEIAAATGCGLLLDINNVFVSARNHGGSPRDYLANFPLKEVGEIHLAGHFQTTDDVGAPLYIDAHGSSVEDNVLALFASVLAWTGPLPTLIEWDNDVPDWAELREEALAAQNCLDRIGFAGALSAA